MKILAESNETYVVEIGRDELANLVGYYSKYQAPTDMLKPGVEIAVHSMYAQLRELARTEDCLKEQAKKLRDMADCMDGITIPVKKVD